jgi:chromosome segregation ATPase
MKTPEEITEGIRERFYNLLPADKSNPLYTAIAAAIHAEREKLERLKQGIQQVVPLGAVDQIVSQQEEIDRLKTELERVTKERDEAQQKLEALRMVVVKWNGFCPSSRQAEETEACISGWNKRAADALSERDTARQQLRECWSVLEASREALRQLVNLANVNPTIRSMLQSLGNSFNNLLLKHQKGETK